jgi:hypothetical protein
MGSGGTVGTVGTWLELDIAGEFDVVSDVSLGSSDSQHSEHEEL